MYCAPTIGSRGRTCLLSCCAGLASTSPAATATTLFARWLRVADLLLIRETVPSRIPVEANLAWPILVGVTFLVVLPTDTRATVGSSMPIFPFAWRAFLSREGQGKRALALGNPTSRRTHVFRNGGASQASCCCELCRPDWWSNDDSSIPSTPPLSPSPPLSGCLAPLSGGGRTTRVSKPARFLGHRSEVGDGFETR